MLSSAFLYLSISIFSLAIIVLFAKQLKYHSIIVIALLNVITAISSAYFPEGEVHSGIIRAIIMIGFLAYYIPKLDYDATTKIIIIYLVYLLVLTPFSSNIERTFSTYIKHGISLMMFPIAYSYFKNINNIVYLCILTVASLSLFILNYIIAQYLGIGSTPYYEGGVYLGGGGVQQTYLIVYFLLIIPIFFQFTIPSKLKNIIYIIYPVAIIPLLLIGRRGAILGFLIGVLVYLFFTYRKSKAILMIVIVVLSAIFAINIFHEQFTGILEHRMRGIEEPERIGRFAEYYWAKDLIRDKGYRHALFGSELFNYQSISGGRRPLHNDFTTFLIGAGIVGLSLYIFIYVTMMANYRRNERYINSYSIRKELRAVLYSLIAAGFVISISGQYYVISALAILFILLGAILGISEDISIRDGVNSNDLSHVP